MPSKNPNPKVIAGTDARIEGQLQVEDVIVLDPIQSGNGLPVVLSANSDVVQINGSDVSVLDEDGLVPVGTLPQVGLVNVTVVEDEEEQLALDSEEGDVVVRTDLAAAFMRNGASTGEMTDWTQISFLSVSSVAGKVGEVTLEKADITDFSEEDYAPAVHTHGVADITDFDPDDKAEAVHTHGVADITDFDPDDKADAVHTHEVADISDLDITDLDTSGLADAVHTHGVADITDFDPDDKAEAVHTHGVADITDFDPDDKADAVHTHEVADISDLDITDLDTSGLADAVHTHGVADITDFDPDDKADADHTHEVADITDLNERQTLTQTVTVNYGDEASVSLPLAKAFGLWKLSTNKAARIRLYSTSADRTADVTREEQVAPDAGTGLITEVITSNALLDVPLSPPQFGASLETTPSSNISALVENKGMTNDVTITLTWTPFG